MRDFTSVRGAEIFLNKSFEQGLAPANLPGPANEMIETMLTRFMLSLVHNDTYLEQIAKTVKQANETRAQ